MLGADKNASRRNDLQRNMEKRTWPVRGIGDMDEHTTDTVGTLFLQMCVVGATTLAGSIAHMPDEGNSMFAKCVSHSRR